MTLQVSFVSEVPDLREFQALLLDYYRNVVPVAAAAGLTGLDPHALAQLSIEHLHEMLPPDERLALARRQGIARRLFEMRIAKARRVGWTKVYADTAKGNRPMLDMYEGFGFR
ncbi:MAG: GNAT family N-acetyltransferase [Roseobacter sp.]|nr:GNAT family N-acetyltransferase [Roseobacter sp.]